MLHDLAFAEFGGTSGANGIGSQASLFNDFGDFKIKLRAHAAAILARLGGFNATC